METFKYSLDKSSKKHICPNCNKRTFVLYIDTNSGEYLPFDFGRCDREQSCNYHKAPPKGKLAYLIDYLTISSITDKAYKLVDLNGIISIVPKSQILEFEPKSCWISEFYLKTSTITYLSSQSKYFNNDEVLFLNVPKPQSEVKAMLPSFHSLTLLNDMYFENPIEDNLTAFLKTKFSKSEVFEAMQNYFITGTNLRYNKATVFWQIDNNENIRHGKIMLYDPITGKRQKDEEGKGKISSIRSALKENDFNLCQCLFGLHRINEDYQKTIAIVESEKTAIVMSIFLPDFIWIATGSKGQFKPETLQPLKGRNVIGYPDKGAFNEWKIKALELNDLGYNISISDLIEKTNYNDGFDLADYYFLSI
jgi:hypothetical protein